MSYPTSIDTFATPGTYLSSNPHSSLHTAEATALTAIETKVGVDNSAVTTSLDYILKSTSSSNPGHKHTLASLSDFNVSSSATGDILRYNGTKYANTPASTIPIKFGGTGSDGALSITSGTTTINLGGLQVVTKNYTSISITGTGALAFSNPHANGTTIILKSQGNVTLTSSATPLIDASGMGSSATNDAYGFTLKVGVGGDGGVTTGGTAGAISVYSPTTAITASIILAGKYPFTCPGAGGGNSHSGVSGNGGGGGASIIAAGNAASNTNTNTGVARAGGNGGGVLIIECGGAWNFTTASGITVAGKNGTNGSSSNDGGGGGGGGGVFLGLYNTLTANTGTVVVSGGTGGTKTGSGTNGALGASGYSSISLNSEYA